MPEVFDLSNYDGAALSEKGVAMAVKNPVNGQEMPGVEITLKGLDSEVFRKLTRKFADKRIEGMMKGRRGVATLTSSMMEDEQVQVLTACTIGWKGLVMNGKPFEFSPANAKTLYNQFSWLRDQVDEFINDRKNFLGN